MQDVEREDAGIVGETVVESDVMRETVQTALRVAPKDVPVMLVGETGTGKEHLARMIHEGSERGEGPFVAVNCASLPEPVFESELFGHEKGAFTGADEASEGLFRAAEGGTLFLDEIAEMPREVQPRLLRALEARRVRPVGGTEEVPVDVRIVAATNRQIESMVEAGQFRRDLYYRLKVVGIQVPPLREREGGVLPLTRQLIREACEELCDEDCQYPCRFTDEAREALLAYDWPGNVRELNNAIQRAAALAEGRPIVELSDLPPEVRAAVAGGDEEGQGEAGVGEIEGVESMRLEDVRRAHILRVLEHFDGHREKTAEALGISETTLWRRLREYGVLESGGR